MTAHSELWIIDDDPVLSPMLKRAVERAEIVQSVRWFSQGKAAVDATKEKLPDAVLLDLMMPYDDQDYSKPVPNYTKEEAAGLRVARELIVAKLSPGRIIVLTALDEPSHKEKLIDLGISKERILIKPVYGRDIILALRTVLRYNPPITGL